MRHSFIDRYSRLTSPVHKVPVQAKLLVTVALLMTCVTVPITSAAVFLIAGVFLVTVAFLSRVPLLFLLRRLLMMEFFAAGITALSLFQPNGWAVFMTLAVRSTMCLFTIVLFANTTPFSELLQLLKRWRFPRLMITTLALMYRYLFVMIDEMERMQRARRSRTFAQRRSVAWHTLATVVSQLFVRSTERAERIYAAMCARGWK